MSRSGTVVLCLLLASCVPAPGTGADTTTSSGATTGLAKDPVFVLTLDDAVAVSAASNGTRLAVAWTTPDVVMMSLVDTAGGQLVDEHSVNGSVIPIAHPIERPGLAVRDDGGLDVAFTSAAGEGAAVYLSSAGADPHVVSGTPRPETNLVHLTLAPDGSLFLAWLEDATLSVAAESENGVVEMEAIDESTCDCCNPVPTFVGGSLAVSYRDFDNVGGEIVRNATVVRSPDGGTTWELPLRVADEDWFINGCPFSGPAAIESNGSLVLAWMDARQSLHPDQTDSSIWVDRSSDGGGTFGTDLRVAGGARHRWPTMAVDEESNIHLVWETEGREGGLSYAWSSDLGESFSTPVILVDRDMSGGSAPVSPTAVVHGGNLIVTWATIESGFVAAFKLG